MAEVVVAKKPAEPWYEPRYRNCGRLEEFLGDTEPFWVEVVAVRFGQWINGCYSLDWTHESWIVTILRELGPGFRFGFFFVSLYIVVLARFVLGHPKVFEYGLESDNSTLRFANATVIITFTLWLVDLALLCWSHFLVRWEGASNDDANCTPFVRPFPRQLREVRRSRPRGARQLLEGALFGVYFLAHYVLGALAIHTVMAHMYIQRNPFFAAIFGVLAFMMLLASLDDLTQIGSPWGIQENSKMASVLLSFRGLFLVPITVLWSIASILASFPPSRCVEC